VTGSYYPQTILEFAARFHNDETCIEYLIQNRWPNGFVCSHCGSEGGWWLIQYRRFECRKCHRQTSPLAGTLMHRTHLPIRIWFWATYLVTTHTPGISALQLQRQLGISKIDPAWFLLHRLRQGMVRNDRSPLSGLIEADEAYIGGPAKGKKGRGITELVNKTLILGAVEVKTYRNKEGQSEEKAGRLRLQTICSASETEIKKFLNTNVVSGSAVRTDGWQGYSTTALEGYNHIRQIQGLPVNAKQLAPHIHKVFGNLKSWLNGTHHGVDPKYMQAYLDEFVFRFNRREHPMAAFLSLIGLVVSKHPFTHNDLTKP